MKSVRLIAKEEGPQNEAVIPQKAVDFMAIYKFSVNKSKFLKLLHHYGIVTTWPTRQCVFNHFGSTYWLSDFDCDYKLSSCGGRIMFVINPTCEYSEHHAVSEELLLSLNMLSSVNKGNQTSC